MTHPFLSRFQGGAASLEPYLSFQKDGYELNNTLEQGDVCGFIELVNDDPANWQITLTNGGGYLNSFDSNGALGLEASGSLLELAGTTFTIQVQALRASDAFLIEKTFTLTIKRAVEESYIEYQGVTTLSEGPTNLSPGRLKIRGSYFEDWQFSVSPSIFSVEDGRLYANGNLVAGTLDLIVTATSAYAAVTRTLNVRFDVMKVPKLVVALVNDGNVVENTPLATVLATVSVVDSDETGWQFALGRDALNFATIKPNGQIVLQSDLDYEAFPEDQKWIPVEVMAARVVNGQPVQPFISTDFKLTVLNDPADDDPIVYRLATRQYGAGYNNEAPQLAGDGTVKTYSLTLTNESGAPIETASLAFQGWGLVTTGTLAIGNDFAVDGNIEYPVGGTQTAIQTTVVPDGGSIRSPDVALPTAIPPGASFKINLSTTPAAGQKYCVRLGFAGLVTKAKASTLRKEAIYGVGDSIATNNNGAVMNASAGRCPAYLASIVGTLAQAYGANASVGFGRQVALAKLLGITSIFSNWSTNDVGAGRTVAQILGDLQNMRSLANAEGIKWVQTTMTPRVTKKAAVAATSLTSAGNVMTLKVPDASQFVVNQAYTIAGATPAGYNGSQVCIARDLSANTISFPCVAGLATPATGSITVVARGTATTAEFQQAVAAYAAGPDSTKGQFNAAVRGGAFDGYVDWADALEPSREAGRFAVAGEKSSLPLPAIVSVIAGATRTASRFFTTYAVGSNTMANGLIQFLTGALAGVLKGASNNTGGDLSVSSAFAAAPAVGDQAVQYPGVCYISDDGLHPRVSTGGMGGQVLLDNALAAWIDQRLAA